MPFRNEEHRSDAILALLSDSYGYCNDLYAHYTGLAQMLKEQATEIEETMAATANDLAVQECRLDDLHHFVDEFKVFAELKVEDDKRVDYEGLRLLPKEIDHIQASKIWDLEDVRVLRCAIDEKDAVIAQKDALIAEKDAMIAKKDAMIAEMEKKAKDTNEVHVAHLGVIEVRTSPPLYLID
jgi:hypothetical protein